MHGINCLRTVARLSRCVPLTELLKLARNQNRILRLCRGLGYQRQNIERESARSENVGRFSMHCSFYRELRSTIPRRSFLCAMPHIRVARQQRYQVKCKVGKSRFVSSILYSPLTASRYKSPFNTIIVELCISVRVSLEAINSYISSRYRN